MAAIVYPTDAVMMAVVNREGNADLLFTLTESSVALPQQWRLISLGFCSIRRFSGIEDSRAAVRAALVTDLELDPTAVGQPGQTARLALSAVVTAWEAAKERISQETHLRAEARVLGVTRQVDATDRTAMRLAVELRFGKIPLHEAPSGDYISHKLEQLEENELIACPLDEVSSMTDADLSATVPGYDNSGRTQLFRKRAKGSLPLTPEAFRTRLRVERNVWLYLATKFVNRPFLAGLTQAVWEEWTDYFLGSKVFLLEVMHADGTKHSLNPPWNIILNHELECRKQAMIRVVENNINLNAALSLVIKDPELKELAFTSPIALAGRSGKGQQNGWANPKARSSPYGGGGKGNGAKGSGQGKGAQSGKGPGRGQSKGPGRGRGKGKGKGLAKGTPDGRQICFAYNSPEGCSTPCPHDRLHVCRNWGCFGPHPILECPHRAAGA